MRARYKSVSSKERETLKYSVTIQVAARQDFCHLKINSCRGLTTLTTTGQSSLCGPEICIISSL